MHPAQVLSYNKMLGQLHDAGNTTTLANYLKLLETAFLVSGLELFRQGRKTRRGSSPKLVIRNNALVNALVGDRYEDSRSDYVWWGRLVENAVGAHLLNHFHGLPDVVFYWRYRNMEVDFVVKSPRKVIAIEVKSGRQSPTKGLSAFCKEYPKATPVIIGAQGIGFEEFFLNNPTDLL